MNSNFSLLKDIITRRRTVKPQAMNGGAIPDDILNDILLLADFAPTHGLTEPWRFIVFGNDSRKIFCRQHAELYKASTSTGQFDAAKYENLLHMGDNASHIVIAVMQRGNLEKIPVWEEEAAVAAAIQNILLGATATGIASYWGSGGMARRAEFKQWLQLKPDDTVLGVLYFGYADKQPAFKRNIPFNEKVFWR
jgi:nitroreductase